MKISYQSGEGHTTSQELSDAQVRREFDRLTGQGYRAFAGTPLTDGEGPVKRVEDIPAGTKELYFIAPLVGG